MSDDTLRSTSYARIIDVISEGEIDGLVAGAQSIYLDGTPVQAANGTVNFSGVKFAARNGTAMQPYIPGFPSAEATSAVNVELKENVPAVRTITNDETDSVTVIVSTPALSRTDKDDGDVVATTVRLRFEVQVGAGPWVQVPASGSQTLPLLNTAAGVGTTGYSNISRATVTVEPIMTSGDDAVVDVTLRRRPLSGGAWTTVSTKPTTNGAPVTWEETLTAGAWEWSAVYGGTLSGYQLNLSGTFYWATDDMTITGKSSSKYQRAMSIRKPGAAPWSIRVTRMTDDSDSNYLQNKTYWDSYVEVVEDKLRMPYTAAVALTIDAQQISSIPTRGYDMRLLKVKVPSNYDGRRRVYTGSWDGTFKAAKEWTDDPAWCFYDLITNTRYGLGAFVGTGVDKWALYQISQYCNELVPDGFGGQERRFSCNAYIASRAEAFKVVNDLASLFRGMVYWSSGSVTLAQDAPGDPVALYAPANVIDGMFTYQGSSLKQRHTVALVTWNDPAKLYEQQVEYVEDREGIELYGIVQTEIAAFGCTSRGQAHRAGRALLLSERLLSEVVTFRTGLEGVRARPGQVINIADPLRAGVRYGGRLLAATATSVTIDAPVDIPIGRSYTLSCLKADGTVQESGAVPLTDPPVTTDTFTVSLAEAPAVGSMWVLACAEVEPQQFRVLTVTETERGIYEITAIAHNPGKYASIDTGVQLQPRDVTDLQTKPGAVENLAVAEALYARGQQLATRLDVSWTLPAGANAAAVSWRRSDGARSAEQTVYEAGIEVDSALEGQVYTFTVYAMNPLGVRSADAATYTHTVQGKAAPPANVGGFVVARTGDTATFSWRAIADLDADRYEIRRGDLWDTGITVASVAHPATTAQVSAPRGGTFHIRAIDTSGNPSAASAVCVLADSSTINVVMSYVDPLTGARSSLEIYATESAPSWDGSSTWDGAGTWDTFISRTGLALVAGATSGTYESQVVDVGYVSSSQITLDAVVESLGPLTFPWSTYTQPWSYYSGADWVWRAADGAVGAECEISTSEDGLNWSDWAVFTPGGYRFRYARMRVTLTTDDQRFRPYLTRLALLVDVPDRVERFADVAVSAAGATIAFSPAFIGVQTVQVSIQSGAVGDTYRLTSKSATGITVQLFNAAGTAKAGVVDIDVYGYGEKY